MPTREDILNAAYAGDTDKLRQLAAEGADFNEIDKSGDTPLHEAIMEICSVDNPWRYEVVSTLLKLGADPNILGEFGDGPLTIAMYRMDVPMLRMLLESGADPNKPAGSFDSESFYDLAEWDYEFLHCSPYPDKPSDAEIEDPDLYLRFLDRMAIKCNYVRPEHLYLLRSYGALSKKEMERQGAGPETQMLEKKLTITREDILNAAYADDTDRLRQLAEEGVDFNKTDDNGDPILQEFLWGITQGWDKPTPYDALKILLELGADPNYVPEHACSPLFYGVLAMNTKIIEILLDAGTDPNILEAGDYSESLYDWGEFDYRYEMYDCQNYPEEPTEEDKKNEDAWLAYLDRIAAKYNVRRPDHLILLRSRGALTGTELGWYETDAMSTKEPPILTELDAATEYARAWNRLDCKAFLALLASDARYASQWVYDELKGKIAIGKYLKGKMNTVKNCGSEVFAELGRTTTGFAGRDCVCMAQGTKEQVTAIVLFEVVSGKIKRYDLCIPELLGVVRSGIYPI